MAAKHTGIAILLLAAAALPIHAQTQGDGLPTPRPAPPATTDGATAQPGLSVLDPADHALFQRAFAAADKRDWVDAMALGDQGHDTTARQLLQWRYALDQDSGAKFADVDDVLKMATGWPLRNTLYARAEADITPNMSPAQIVRWFGTRNPASSIGRIRLGEALVASGDKTKGATLINQGWSQGSFDPPTETQILATDATYLTPASDRARLDALLWRDELTAARRQIARVDAHTAAIARARIALSTGLARARSALAGVAGSDDPTLLYDWARALRAQHQDAEANAKLLAAKPALLARDHAARWWQEVAIEARDALKAGKPRVALQLVDHAGLPVGDQYAEQQFLAGFIALRFLKEPAAALTYFQHLAAHVSLPISKARAQYWLARAYEALGDNALAYGQYRLAAAYSDTFYGQLATAHIESDPVLHLNDSPIMPIAKAGIENDALMPQIRVLADLGREADLRLFAAREADSYSAPAHLAEFLQSLTDWGYPQIAVRLAKTAGYAGAAMPRFAYPIMALPPYYAPGQGPDPALVLALIRQETEFDAGAVSSAGAQGLMQMMLSAAKTSSKIAGIAYRPDALISDPAYNIQLGMIEFMGHYNSWNGSLVLAAAAYNAGPGNVRKWIAANGDPRQPDVDPIDWIEQIPFGETRNYVQRVLENMEVYRDRLAGKDTPLRILADLYAPETPPAAILAAPVVPRPPSKPDKTSP